MSGLRTTIKFFLYGSPLYRPARWAYLSLFDRGKLQNISRAVAFYREFVRTGDLVFDIGANVGDYTDMFLRLGARVVSVEPNPDCAGRIRRLVPRGSLYVENVAVGERDGFAELSICDKHDDISTLSEDWKREAERRGQLGEEGWQRTVRVPVTTLDALAERYGNPRFIKIDTEGFDAKVLEGMSFRPPSLSFEFILDIPEVARRCLEILGDQYTYNYISGRSFEFDLQRWVEVAEMSRMIEDIRCPEGFGDIFAQKKTGLKEMQPNRSEFFEAAK